jgi:hypothetical protein
MKTKNKALYSIFALIIVFGMLAIALPTPAQAMDNDIVSAAVPTRTPTVYNGRPYLRVVSVEVNKYATFEGSDFPANTKFTILIGPYIGFGTKSVYVGRVNTLKGKFTFTVKFPKVIKKVDLVNIRLDSAMGYYATTWFHNDTTAGRYYPTPTPNTPTANACELLSVNPTLSMHPKDTFNAIWVVRNTGTVEWSVYSIDYKYVNGKHINLGADGFDLPYTVSPGGTVTIKVYMQAPQGTGTFTTNWAIGNKKITVCKLPLTIKVVKE